MNEMPDALYLIRLIRSDIPLLPPLYPADHRTMSLADARAAHNAAKVALLGRIAAYAAQGGGKVTLDEGGGGKNAVVRMLDIRATSTSGILNALKNWATAAERRLAEQRLVGQP